MDTRRPRATPLDDDLLVLRRVLADLPFPALRDEVLVELVARQAPHRVVGRLLGMSPAERYGSVDDLCAKLRLAGRRRRRTRPPWA